MKKVCCEQVTTPSRPGGTRIRKRATHPAVDGILRVETLDCNECKHRLTCLLRPEVLLTFESK